jgi:hypothetical protein
MKQISIFHAVIQNYQESSMNKQTILIYKKALTTIIAIATLSAFSSAATSAHAGTSMHRTVEGVWMVTTTPRNCNTGAAVPGAAFEGMFTFHKDGTMSAWMQNSLITVTRSPSHGLWQRDLGWRKYVFKFIHLRYDASGFYSGIQEAEGSLILDKSGNEFTTDSATTVFDVDGNVLGGGCATAVGTRFDWDE